MEHFIKAGLLPSYMSPRLLNFESEHIDNRYYELAQNAFERISRSQENSTGSDFSSPAATQPEATTPPASEPPDAPEPPAANTPPEKNVTEQIDGASRADDQAKRKP